MEQVVEMLHRPVGVDLPVAFVDDDIRYGDDPTVSGPLAAMCIDANGRLLFATARALEMAERWNAALGHSNRSSALRLPTSVQTLYAATFASMERPGQASAPSMPDRWVMHHPQLPQLTLTVNTDGRQAQMGASDCYMLWLEEKPILARLQSLSPSERRVALLVAQGLRNHEIAETLCRSRRTVEFQLNSIYRKLEVSCRTQLVRALL